MEAGGRAYAVGFGVWGKWLGEFFGADLKRFRFTEVLAGHGIAVAFGVVAQARSWAATERPMS